MKLADEFNRVGSRASAGPIGVTCYTYKCNRSVIYNIVKLIIQNKQSAPFNRVGSTYAVEAVNED
jgi:hypothetical protein